jgi:hypothetical protein
VRQGVPPVAVVTAPKAGARSPRRDRAAAVLLPFPSRATSIRVGSGDSCGSSPASPVASRTDTDGRARRRRQGRSRSPRHGGVRGRRPDGGGLVPVTPFPGPRSVLVAPDVGRADRRRPSTSPERGSPGPCRYRTETGHRPPHPGAPEGAAARSAPGAVGRLAATCPSSLGYPTGAADLQERVRGRSRAGTGSGSRYEPSDRGGADLRTGSGDRSSSPSDTSACWVAPKRVGGRPSPTGSGSLDATPLFGLTISPGGAGLDLGKDRPESG